MAVDYSLYLVTDSTTPILKDRDLVDVVRAAIEGGVTIVQYRDKTSETADLIRTGKALHALCKQAGIPLLINDRVDVALVVGCEGVHIGQDDIDLTSARRLLGKDAIIGVTVRTIDEAVAATQGGADYLGVGAIFATPTKENAKQIIGTAGTKEILDVLAKTDQEVATVCIGGVNASNVQRVLYQSAAPAKQLDGVAIVSAIVGAADPKQAAADLKRLITSPPPFALPGLNVKKARDVRSLLQAVPGLVKRVGEEKPLSHNMTNMVVQNFAANVALSIGASPIMSGNGDEAADLARFGGGLVINMGTATPDSLANYTKAMRAYNLVGGPVLFDPVGAGATAVRREAARALLAAGYFDIIKGNEGEIKTVSGVAGAVQRGVDSGSSTLSGAEKARLVKSLAARERNVCLMSGSTDYLSDGERTYAISNGHPYLGEVTGSGCTLGTTMVSFAAIHREDKLLAALAGILMYEIAAERAGVREDVKGTGSFIPAFLDELYGIQKQAAAGNSDWLAAAKVEEVY